MNVFKNLIIAGLLTASCIASAKTTIQIVGGSEASINEFPYIVSLQYGDSHFCGGSLIKKNWILTASHCVKGMSVSKILIGLHDQKDRTNAEVMTVKRVIAHPKFNTKTFEYDYALIELNENSSFKPVALNTAEIDLSGPEVMATVAGWGTLKESSYSLPDKLQRVDVPLVPLAACNVAYKDQVKDSTMICAGYLQGGKDSCQGDSGGPLVVTDQTTNEAVLVGVVSWGQGCARAKYYGVYSKVNAVIDWIDKNTMN